MQCTMTIIKKQTVFEGQLMLVSPVGSTKSRLKHDGVKAYVYIQ